MKQFIYGFVGLGLIGGSMAKTLKKIQGDCKIYAYTRTKATTDAALSQGLIDEVCASTHDPKFTECDYIFLCAPVGNNIKALEELKGVINPDCVLTDVGSVKTNIHEAVDRLGLNAQFIGGHPMTGSEKTGLANATDHLFENAYYILTPSPDVPKEWVERYRDLAASFGAIPLILDYREHDFITAAVSHLPHVIASALVNTVHNLDSSEKFYIAGYNGVRAFPQGEASGDDGFLGSFELRQTLGNSNFKLAAFYDVGWVNMVHHNPFGNSESRYLQGAGLGLIYQQPGDWYVRIDYAMPIGDRYSNSYGHDMDGIWWFQAVKKI